MLGKTTGNEGNRTVGHIWLYLKQSMSNLALGFYFAIRPPMMSNTGGGGGGRTRMEVV